VSISDAGGVYLVQEEEHDSLKVGRRIFYEDFFNFWDFFPFLYFFPLFIYFWYVCFLKNNYQGRKYTKEKEEKVSKGKKSQKKNPKRNSGIRMNFCGHIQVSRPSSS